jgi:hypothetical protein
MVVGQKAPLGSTNRTSTDPSSSAGAR